MRDAALLRANALHIPLADASVDLIVTSPPYFALRSYQDDGDHFAAQIGSEATPKDFLEALWAVTAECKRVLKPSGVLFVNLGDKYAGSGGHNNSGISNHGMGSSTLQGNGKPDVARREALKQRIKATRRSAPDRYNQESDGIRAKSLMGLPWRYAIGCIDRLDLILRAELIWSKPNGLPESVTDRPRRSHEQWFMFTKEPRYYSAIDELREPSRPENVDYFSTQGQNNTAHGIRRQESQPNNSNNTGRAIACHPLGKLPGSVWNIPSEPLQVPEWLGVDHFAAFPQEWPRRLILGWSPPGVCQGCGQGRRPITEREPSDWEERKANGEPMRHGLAGAAASGAGGFKPVEATITGYGCDCPTPTAPTTPAVVLDPFVGTGTVPMVARALGRYGIGLDLSSDYLRLASWRVFTSGAATKSIARTNSERQGTLL